MITARKTLCKACGKMKKKLPFFKWFCEHCTRTALSQNKG